MVVLCNKALFAVMLSAAKNLLVAT